MQKMMMMIVAGCGCLALNCHAEMTNIISVEGQVMSFDEESVVLTLDSGAQVQVPRASLEEPKKVQSGQKVEAVLHAEDLHPITVAKGH